MTKASEPTTSSTDLMMLPRRICGDLAASLLPRGFSRQTASGGHVDTTSGRVPPRTSASTILKIEKLNVMRMAIIEVINRACLVLIKCKLMLFLNYITEQRRKQLAGS